MADAVPGSFRDPRGFLFHREGVLYRHVDASAAADYDLFESSGLRASLHDAGLLIPHEDDPALAAERGAARVLRPEVVPFISYPYEWSFSQLRDAALLTLRLQSTAMDHGMSLRDASAYNVQFHRGRPLLIDTLSFERAAEGTPWVAYRQFCQHFLAPLALMSYRDVRLGLMLRDHLDGVPLDLAASLLPRRAQARPPLQLHLFLHAKSQRRHAADGAGAPGWVGRRERPAVDSASRRSGGSSTACARGRGPRRARGRRRVGRLRVRGDPLRRGRAPAQGGGRRRVDRAQRRELGVGPGRERRPVQPDGLPERRSPR